MKRIFTFMLLAFLCLSNASLLAEDEMTLFDARNKIFDNSKEIRPLVNKPEDTILANSMWDTCIMTVNQLDAYFSMLGMLNTIKDESLSEVSVKYLSDWLENVKSTNSSNIKAVSSSDLATSKAVEKQMKKMKVNLEVLEKLITEELEKIEFVVKAIRLKKAQAQNQ